MGVKVEPFNMEFERETNQIDREGNFMFENKRVEEATDAWLESFKDQEDISVEIVNIDRNASSSKGP